MTAEHDLDQQLAVFLREGPERLPDASFDAVRDRTEQTRQRVGFGPWRVPTVNKLVPIGLGAAAVIAVLFLGSRFIGSPTSNVGGTASQPPATAAPSEAPASAAPSHVFTPPLSQTFTSQMHGISVSHPEGWIAQAATEPWTDCLYCTAVLTFPQIDLLHPPEPIGDGLFLRIASQPIGESAPEDWVATQMASDDRCTTTEPITVDGATGLSGGETCTLAVVTTAGRGYHIDLWMSPDDRDVFAQYDRAWFEDVLATVQLRPEDARDAAASATP